MSEEQMQKEEWEFLMWQILLSSVFAQPFDKELIGNLKEVLEREM